MSLSLRKNKWLGQLWIDQHGLCWICKKPMLEIGCEYGPTAPSIDHINPVKRHGNCKRRNILLAHVACNTERGAPPRQPTLKGFKTGILQRLALVAMNAPSPTGEPK